jgi:hypothetical protein
VSRVAVVSFFRNAAGLQVNRFLNQCALLAQAPEHAIRISAIFGDCVDRTAEHLVMGAAERNLALTLCEASHGGPEFGSTERPERLHALSIVGNTGLRTITEEDDYVFYVESDLIWSSATVLNLLRTLSSFERPSVLAPLIFAGEHFYDVFCYRGRDGERFSPFYPYHRQLREGGITPVNSVGSGFVMHGEVARNCRIVDDNVLIGFCKDVWEKGYSVNVDAREYITHPA